MNQAPIAQASSDASTNDRVLDTAAALFWRKGFAGTTTREIAAAVGIQQASLYHHMSSKEDLLYEICVTSLKEFLTDVQSAVASIHDPLEKVRVLIRAHLTTLFKHQQRNVTMITELRSLSRQHRAEVVELRERYSALVRSILTAAQEAGFVRTDIAAKYLALALLNMLNWALLWFREGHGLSAEQLAGLFVTIYLDGAATVEARRRLPSPDVSGGAKPLSGNRKSSKSRDSAMPERLASAAVALFSRKGYVATSTREVAALLGMQKASLYYHVQSKEDLLYFICKSSLETIRRDVETAIQEASDPLDRMTVLMVTHIESMLRDAGKHSTTLAEMNTLSQDRREQVVALRHDYDTLVQRVLLDAQKAGVLRSDIDERYLRLSLLGLLNRVLVWHRRGGALSAGQLGRVLAAIFLGGAAVHR